MTDLMTLRFSINTKYDNVNIVYKNVHISIYLKSDVRSAPLLTTQTNVWIASTMSVSRSHIYV